VLVGHVTKDGGIAGPRVLEHLVDVVCQFEGDRQSRLRMVRAVKNRFGPSDEVGCFDLGDAGIEELPDPSGLFLTRRQPGARHLRHGCARGGGHWWPRCRRWSPRPAGHAAPGQLGLDSSRLSMVLAVLERRCGLDLSKRDVYSATVGGVRVAEPAADLAVGLAIASATLDRPLPTGVVAIGEIGLAGEIRRVSGLSRRLAEAVRLGFDHALVPPDPGTIPAGLRVSVVTDMGDLLTTLAQSAGSSARRSQLDFALNLRGSADRNRDYEEPCRHPAGSIAARAMMRYCARPWPRWLPARSYARAWSGSCGVTPVR
jgi:DNA repair protein RadA/Sms